MENPAMSGAERGKQVDLLRTIVEKRDPSLIFVLDKIERVRLLDSERQQLQTLVGEGP